VIEQQYVANVQGGLMRLERELSYILYGDNKGHRFPDRPWRGGAVVCQLCKGAFPLETDSKIPVPTDPCPDRETNESEKADRTVEMSSEVCRNALELACEARVLLHEGMKESPALIKRWWL